MANASRDNLPISQSLNLFSHTSHITYFTSRFTFHASRCTHGSIPNGTHRTTNLQTVAADHCKECGFPTCLAFAMKLAAKQAELASCPYVSDAAKGQLESASAPPIRLVTVSSNGYKVAAGNETVLFRHEKTFYHPPGLFVRVRDTQPLDEVRAGPSRGRLQGRLRGAGPGL
ncbi:MAG: (Fe-S)-binding protein [Caldilineaceae bacterium]